MSDVLTQPISPSEDISVEPKETQTHTAVSMGACTVGFTITVELEATQEKVYGPYFVSEDALQAIKREIADEIGISAEHDAHRFKVTAGKIARQAAKTDIPSTDPDVRQAPIEMR